MAELEQLGIGVFEQLHGGFRAGFRVVNEGGIPSQDGHVVRVVRHCGLQDFAAFAVGKSGILSADDLRDLLAAGAEKLSGEGLPSMSRMKKMK